MDTVKILIIVIAVYFVGLIYGVTLVAPAKEEIICEYEGGVVEGDVCIVDNKVFDIDD